MVMLAGHGWLGVFHPLSLQDCGASPMILLQWVEERTHSSILDYLMSPLHLLTPCLILPVLLAARGTQTLLWGGGAASSSSCC